MKTPEELTAITLGFLGEHSNEAAWAVVLAVVWNLVWERRGKRQHAAVEREGVVGHQNGTAEQPNAARQQQQQRQDSAAEKKRSEGRKTKPLLRGNLKNELKAVLQEKEELERLVLELRSEIEYKNRFRMDVLHSSPTPSGRHPSSIQMPHPTRRTIHGTAWMVRTTIGVTTCELDTLGSCWALLVFGFCLLSSRRYRRGHNPFVSTVDIVERLCSAVHHLARDHVAPALSKIHAYLSQALHTHVASPECGTGRAIAACLAVFRSGSEAFVGSIEGLVYERILPCLARIASRGVACAHLVVNTIAAIEWPKRNRNGSTSGSEQRQLPTILLSVHEHKVLELEESLRTKTSEQAALEEKLSGLRQALRGKEVLLYEERMKTRSAKLKNASATIEGEETRRREKLASEAAAHAAYAEDHRRLLRRFLSRHLLCRQQGDRLRKIDEKNAPKSSKIVLPDPILQGFASAMYLQNLSDLSGSDENSNPQQQQQQQQRFFRSDAPMDCRDDVGGACREDECYYGRNVSENKLGEIREQFLQSRKVARSIQMRPKHNDASRDTIHNTANASTGSLLWNAASAKENSSSTSAKKIKQQQQQQPTFFPRQAGFSVEEKSTMIAAKLNRTTAATTQPSSWMEDPGSIVCGWHTINDEEVRE
mmetsp:Transcript_22689/g.48141  ORF Transcript_22689/g.48141 Transcript_22689/m.48141 type:complete len:651 (+) Transcript_22689:102-2054(+)